jgi:hypothetical protein
MAIRNVILEVYVRSGHGLPDAIQIRLAVGQAWNRGAIPRLCRCGAKQNGA